MRPLPLANRNTSNDYSLITPGWIEPADAWLELTRRMTLDEEDGEELDEELSTGGVEDELPGGGGVSEGELDELDELLEELLLDDDELLELDDTESSGR